MSELIKSEEFWTGVKGVKVGFSGNFGEFSEDSGLDETCVLGVIVLDLVICGLSEVLSFVSGLIGLLTVFDNCEFLEFINYVLLLESLVNLMDYWVSISKICLDNLGLNRLGLGLFGKIYYKCWEYFFCLLGRSRII